MPKILTMRLALAGVLLVFVSAKAQASSETDLPPASFLSLETKTDGRCQNLSQGGKLAVMVNTHPSQKIRFRLIRYYIDVRQRGRATGIAEPGGAAVKLGCTLVGGRPQRWDIERAEFTTEETR